ncbi:MAG: GNAT family N-acetyltransferase [Erysipelotrichaceae bacterium]|nr:GNAT family N-acetyltransferase [Erysipelotrichaceae bacterium]
MINEATLNDLDAVYKLICILEDDKIDYQHFSHTYKNHMNNKDVIYLVYRYKNDVVGFVSFMIHHYLHHDKDVGEIVELVVKEGYRSQGIGHQLLDEIEKRAKLLALEQIELNTSTYRNDAHRFYEKHGFEMSHYNYTKNVT